MTMTLRQLSERVRDHLTQQRAKSMDGASCAYRGEGGAMCAVGCLIDGANYRAELEGNSLANIDREVENAVNRSLGFELKRNATHMLSLWQGYHDDSRGYSAWLQGERFESPEIFHDARMQDLIDVEVDPDSTAAVPGGAA